METNGLSATPQQPTRASPVPQSNGNPTTASLVERSNPMANGQASPAPQTITSKDPKAAAAAASDMRNIVRRKLTGFVGFANLPNQWHRKSVRKGFNFNVMVVGESGLGKSTLSTHCSTPRSTHQRKASSQVSTSRQRQFPYNPSVQTLKRTVFVSA